MRVSKVFLVVALLAIAAGCGSSHSTTRTKHQTTSETTSGTTSGTTSASPPQTTPKHVKHFDKILTTALTSAASVPKGPPHGSGTAVVRLSAKAHQACWTVTVKRIGKPLSAHVRKAPPGKVGPVIIPLGATFAKSGCVILPLKSIRAVSRNPAAYYVDVLTRKYLDGALRGQLRVRH